MKKFFTAITAVLGLLAAFVLVSAPSAAADEAPAPIVVTAIAAPQQLDQCGPDIIEGGSPNDYIGYSWNHWKLTKTAGVSASLIWYTDPTKNDGFTYKVRYDPRPGYVIADGVQREWQFPAFSDAPC